MKNDFCSSFFQTGYSKSMFCVKLIFRVITAESFDLGDTSYRILFVHTTVIFGEISNNMVPSPLH